MPAPMAPWMSASEELTIWMLSTARKRRARRRPRRARSWHVTLRFEYCRWRAAAAGRQASPAATRRRCDQSLSSMADMAVLCLPEGSALGRLARRGGAGEVAVSRRYRPARSRLVSIVASTDMPARSRPASGSARSSADLHRDALHDLGEVAGRIVGRQQRELEAAGRRQAVDMAAGRVRPESCRPRSSPARRSRTWVSCVSLKLATT